MRLAIIDAPHPDGWAGDSAMRELSPVAALLAGDGHTVTVARLAGAARWAGRGEAERIADAEIPLRSPGPPLIAAPGSLANGAPALAAHAVWRWLAATPPDVALLPATGGLAFYALMARATGAALGGMRIALWRGEGTAARLLADDTAIDTLGPLVADALERGAAPLADAILGDGAGWPVPAHANTRATMRATTLSPAVATEPAAVTEIAFVGPLTRRHGGWLHLDVAERLAAAGLLEQRSVALLGPARAHGWGLTKETLGIRARSWAFRWRLDDRLGRADVLATLAGGRTLAVCTGEAMRPFVSAARQLGLPVLHVGGAPVGDGAAIPATVAAVTEAIERALAGLPVAAAPGGTGEAAHASARQWAAALEQLAAKPAPPAKASVADPTEQPPVTVCLLHKDRGAALGRALASVEAQTLASVETLIVDDASSDAASLAALAEIEGRTAGRTDRRVLRNSHPLFPAAARNLAAAAARGRHLVFLDDDNILLPDGLARLLTAIEHGGFDIVVSCLDAYPGEVPLGAAASGQPAPDQRLLFLGDAAAAGLFANLFGDTAMIVTTAAFQRLGGFPDPGYFAPAEDWAFLATAAAQGARIGVLLDPAFRYAQPAGVLEAGWRKRNQEGALRQILDIYRWHRAADLDLALALGQKLMHQELGF